MKVAIVPADESGSKGFGHPVSQGLPCPRLGATPAEDASIWTTRDDSLPLI